MSPTDFSEATGYGVAFLTNKAAGELSMAPESSRVVIQGFGNVGSHTAINLAKMGIKVIVLADVHGGVICEAGINVATALEYVDKTGSLYNLPGTEAISNDESAIKAKLIVEAANMADENLRQRGIVIVPDLLANAGGVLVSYYEWAQNLQQFPWDRDTVLQRLEQRLANVYDTVQNLSLEHQVDLRKAAYELAIKRVANAISLRGFRG
tara:strand:+ start:1165 stop:1791 length:627 start_codon:yes stop_codon:yes gene_type:complete